MFPPGSEAAARLADLGQVAGSIRSTYERLPNPSGSGGAIAHSVPALAIMGGAGTGFETGGLPGALRGAAIGASTILPGMGLANVLARPAATRFWLGPQTPSRFNPAGFGLGLAQTLAQP